MEEEKYFYYYISLAINSKINFIYSSEKEIAIGTIVKLNFKKKDTIGIVIKKANKNYLPKKEFKKIDSEILTLKKISSYIEFITKFAFYNVCSEAEITRQFLIILLKIQSKKPKKEIELTEFEKNKKKDKTDIILNNEQIYAYKNLCNNKKFYTTLLFGSAGSGKTEIYIKVIDSFLNAEKNAQALVLVPEIGLASQTFKTVIQRSEHLAIEWHSALTYSKKEENLKKILEGKKMIIIGTRSAITIPYQNLKLIIVDEEHDESYKQENIFCYNARDMSVLLAKTLNIPIVLASATPSVETIVNVKKQKYSIIKINEKYKQSSKININIVKTKKTKFMLSAEAVDAINFAISQNKKSLVFLNRKARYNLIVCSKCKIKVFCKNCDSLVIYANSKYKCRHCERELEKIKCIECKSCKNLEFFVEGIEHLKEEIENRIVEAKILTITKETTAKKDFNISNAIKESEANIILGTQIISKGYNFKDLKNVIIIDADSGVLKIDIKANERIFQLMHQIFGRVGRYEDGDVYLQTHNPQSNLIKTITKMDKEKFYDTEIQSRQSFDCPPFSTFVSITITNSKKNTAKKDSETIANYMHNYKKNFQTFGPNTCYMHKIKGKYRYNILLKSSAKTEIQKAIIDFKKNLSHLLKSRIKYDINPISFY